MSITLSSIRTGNQVRARWRRLIPVCTVAATVGFATPSPVTAQLSYAVQDLGALPGDTSSVAQAINAKGDVVGWSNGPSGTRAFVYRTLGGMVALPGLPNRPRSIARDINDAGDIVGSANAGGTDLGHAALWSSSTVRDLGTLGAGLYSEAWGINNLGHIVGTSYTSGGNLLGVHGFLYTPSTGLVDLTPGSDRAAATDINDVGQVTGYITALGGYHAFRWADGSFVDLGVLPTFAHSFGWAINEDGQVAGNSSSASGNSERRFRFTDGIGLEDLGGAGEHNDAWGINAAGHVVGCTGGSQARALRFTDESGVEDLNTLIDPSLGWVLLCAYDINDAGQIAATGYNNFTGLRHAVRLQPQTTPPPECTFHCLFSTAVVVRTRHDGIQGAVTVQDENGIPLAQASVVGRWTYPDGTSAEQYAWTRRNGQAVFRTTAGQLGRYTLTVVNIVLSQYTFNPSRSVLTGEITLTR